jgi:hypothetical protein
MTREKTDPVPADAAQNVDSVPEIDVDAKPKARSRSV